MEAQDVIDIIAKLEGAGIAAWLDGGWGVDALLGEQTRPHSDIDVVLALADVPKMQVLLAADGFSLVEGAPHTNFVLEDERGRRIDVHPARFDGHGNGIYRMENGEDWIYPASGFAGRGHVAGREVRCLTPAVQMLCHAGGYEPDEDDFRDMRALHQRFGIELAPLFRKWLITDH